eukprot:Skav234674  [mRNA]  locus=scaffold1131:475680:480491:- [translate_table: standard]
MPPPFPRWFASSQGPANYRRMCVEKILNLIVVCLSWLRLGKPEVAPPAMSLSMQLNFKQRRVVARFERLASELVVVGDVGPRDMGRAAAKVESLTTILQELQESFQKCGATYEHRPPANASPCRQTSQAGHLNGDPGEVVGRLPHGAPAVAKCVEPSRLSFPAEAPKFDPTELFDEPHRTTYVDPISLATDPMCSSWEPPRVRIHASKKQALELMEFLDRHSRLRLAAAKSIRPKHLCGAFALVKDEHKDRLILDARPPNGLEETLRDWSKTLGAVSAVLQIELLPGHNLIMSGTDLRDYYYCFKVSRQRALRNTFNFPLSPQEVQHLRCFDENMHQYDTLYPSLSTMAMGDTNAVELGQKAHLRIGLRCGAMSPAELLSVHGRAPRGKLSCGVIIDDALFLEQVPQSVPKEEWGATEGAQRLRVMKEEYLRRELTPHPAKTFEGEDKAEFWGASLDGIKGTCRANPKRIIPVMALTSSVARLGYASVALLQAVAGAWVSIFQFRKRLMCLLDQIYVAQHGRTQDQVVRLSGSLVDELWMLVCLGTLAVADLRAESLGELHLSDAAEEMKASVSVEIPKEFAREVSRHSLARGSWTKLLTPWKVWLKEHFDLDEEEELPDGVPLVSHPLWLALARCLAFKLGHRKRVWDRRHINILELESLLEVEEKIGARAQDCRYLCGADSQVALAAVLKGRSSSWALNQRLQKSLAVVLGDGLYGNYGYVPSLANVSDDPTRLSDIRAPVEEVPPWLEDAMSGDFRSMDVWLAQRGYDPLVVAGLPFEPEVQKDKTVMQGSFLQDLRAVQKPDRLAVFDAKHYGSSEKDCKLNSSVAEESGSQENDKNCKGPPGKMNRGLSCLVDGSQNEENETSMEQLVHSVHSVQASGSSVQVQPVKQVGTLGVSLEGTSLWESEEQKRHKELGSQTKRDTRKLSGKTNREPHNSVASEGLPRPKPSNPSNRVTGSCEPPRTAEPVVSPWPVAENDRSPLLSSEALELLQQLPSECFVGPGGRRLAAGADLPFCRRGFLDLYSGKAAVAKSLARRFNVWVCTFDFDHGSNQNLLDEKLQRHLMELLEKGAFLGVGAAPECCSFSRAVCPPVRSALRPEGLENLTANMTKKVRIGNLHAAFLLKLLKLVQSLALPFWTENPDGSFLWLLRGWSAAKIGSPENSFRLDMCRYHTPWRKRTRIATNTCLRGRRELCCGGHSHVLLRGRNQKLKKSWTRVAQVYPRRLAEDLASAMGVAAQLTGKQVKLSIGGCARCSACRIGEASNPGPRAARRVPRNPFDLAGVQLVEPVTQALQARVWRDFEAWLEAKLSDQARQEMLLCAPLMVEILRSYGMYLYEAGHGLYEFRHLVVLVQQRYHWLKSSMGPAWQLVTKWQALQPVEHRKPLHVILYRAIVALGLMHGWYRWSATIVLGFEGIARISEVLRATRGDLVLPSDQFSSVLCSAFLKVTNPKTKRRGKGRVQHLKLSDPQSISFLEKVFGPLNEALSLFPFSAAAFRTRWNKLLEELLVPEPHRPTPASIRGGGAILAYQRGEHITDIMWRMRISTQSTLEHYLQEMAADSIMTRLPENSKHRIRSAALIFPMLVGRSISKIPRCEART